MLLLLRNFSSGQFSFILWLCAENNNLVWTFEIFGSAKNENELENLGYVEKRNELVWRNKLVFSKRMLTLIVERFVTLEQKSWKLQILINKIGCELWKYIQIVVD